MADELVNVREAAAILGVHENTIRNMADDGRLTVAPNPTQFRRFLRADVEAMANRCGGCIGIGNHRKFCPNHPDYHPWKRLAQMANDIGDTIGGNDPGLANAAYQLEARIVAAIPEHPYRRFRA